MKNFDVEKLERKNIFETPDGFFEQMQEKVAAATQQKPKLHLQKPARIVKMNWVYAAAAVITLFFGISFLVNQNNTADPDFGSGKTIANVNNATITRLESMSKPETKPMISVAEQQDLPTLSSIQNKEKTKPTTLVTPVENSATPQKTANPEGQVDQVLANFTNSELADLSRTAEQDIYLDLYN